MMNHHKPMFRAEIRNATIFLFQIVVFTAAKIKDFCKVVMKKRFSGRILHFASVSNHFQGMFGCEREKINQLIINNKLK